MGDEKKKKTSRPLAAAAYGGPVDVSSLESVTPLSMEPEWDPYVHRKQYGVGLQPFVGVMRNDRTPLNTPYTPQLVKLHLKRHEAYDERDEYDERPGKQLVTRSNLQGAMVSRAAVERVVAVVVPRFIQETTLFAKLSPWVVWHFTAVHLHVAHLDLRHCGSIRPLFMRSQPSIEDEFSPDPEEGEEEEEEETSPHHPNSMYRRAHLTNNHSQRGMAKLPSFALFHVEVPLRWESSIPTESSISMQGGLNWCGFDRIHFVVEVKMHVQHEPRKSVMGTSSMERPKMSVR
ncbi:hypothetical protein GQ600_2585 [Phytophthora cactorum]|nr:hypothetical protein GQ600_2585 [Phytophthora cactorum]